MDASDAVAPWVRGPSECLHTRERSAIILTRRVVPGRLSRGRHGRM